MSEDEYSDPRFICDDHLGKLARYLRVAGYDTLYFNSIDDGRLIQRALSEERIILTRDHRLIEKSLVRDYFLVEPDRWPDQLRTVMNRFRLIFNATRMFRRCLEDNTLTRPVEKRLIETQVFPFTYQHHDSYRQCPACRRVFWEGTHIEAVKSRLRRLGFTIPDESASS